MFWGAGLEFGGQGGYRPNRISVKGLASWNSACPNFMTHSILSMGLLKLLDLRLHAVPAKPRKMTVYNLFKSYSYLRGTFLK